METYASFPSRSALLELTTTESYVAVETVRSQFPPPSKAELGP